MVCKLLHWYSNSYTITLRNERNTIEEFVDFNTLAKRSRENIIQYEEKKEKEEEVKRKKEEKTKRKRNTSFECCAKLYERLIQL